MISNLLIRVLLHSLHDLTHHIGEIGHEITGTLFGHNSSLARQGNGRVLQGGKGPGKGEDRVLLVLIIKREFNKDKS